MSALFKPYRALGYITENVPFAIVQGKKSHVLIVSVGKAWQMYDSKKLELVMMGPAFAKKIRALACTWKFTYAAVGTTIEVCKRGTRVGTIRGHSGKIIQLMCIGELLLSLGRDNVLMVWDKDFDNPKMVIKFGKEFDASCMAHPETYINKVVVGSEQGTLQLWNFNTGKLIYKFQGWGSAVKCIEPSPALDVVGIGLGDGRAVLHNLKYDETVHVFQNATGVGMHMAGKKEFNTSGPCTALAFNKDAGVPLLAAGGSAGVITVWNLEEKRLTTVLTAAHDAPLVKLFFFPRLPVLMSAAGDNSIKQWIFDNLDGSGRLLKFRCGHRAPPNSVKFYGDGLKILSGGQDRAFWVFSTIQDQQSRELSQKNVQSRAKKLKMSEEEIKLTRVVDLDACEVRERDWDNAITAHANDCNAYTWRLQNYTIGRHKLRVPREHLRKQKRTPVTAVCLSHCGNFGFVGCENGRVDKYNMQSGLHRGEYRRITHKGDLNAHKWTVSGISTDACNKMLVTGGFDSYLRIWNFKSRHLITQIDIGSSVSHLCMHPGTFLCGVSCDDYVIRVVDVEAGRLVRRFSGHEDRITCMEISSDGRWLLSASLDGTVRVWDIPAAQVFQVMELDMPVTGLSLSRSMEFLATSHVDRRGIYLWTNQSIFGSGLDLEASEKPINICLPVSNAEQDALNNETENEETALVEQDANATASPGELQTGLSNYGPSNSPVPLEAGLVTLSMLPRIQWHNLAHLDLIKARNKAIEPVKKPEAAPFFLPTLPGISQDPIFDLSEKNEEKNEENDREASRIQRGGEGSENKFLRLLREGGAEGDFSTLALYFRQLAPAAIDQAIHELEYLPTPFAEGGEEIGLPQEIKDLEILMTYIESQIDAKRDFEFVQALLRLVLQVHGETIIEFESLKIVAKRVKEKLESSWKQVDDVLQNVHCMVNYFTSWQG